MAEREGRIWSLRVAGPDIRVLQALAQVRTPKVLPAPASPRGRGLSEEPRSPHVPGALGSSAASRAPVPCGPFLCLPGDAKARPSPKDFLTPANGGHRGFSPARRIVLLKFPLSPDQEKRSLNPKKGGDKTRAYILPESLFCCVSSPAVCRNSNFKLPSCVH